MFFSSLIVLVLSPQAHAVPCSSRPLPVVEERTEVVWEGFLNKTLQECFEGFENVVKGIKVRVVGGEFASVRPSITLVPEEGYDLELNIGREYLDANPSMEEILFILGHEVGHALMFEFFGRLQGNEQEFLADLFSAQRIPNGSCHGARVLLWFYTESEMATGIQYAEEREWLRQRRSALLAQCNLPALFNAVLLDQLQF